MRRREHRRNGSASRAFTLVEILVVVSIIAILVSILLPSIATTASSSRGFKCQVALRSAAFDFAVYADDALHGDRGNDASDLPRGRFRVGTFIESQYGIDEFWRWGDVDVFELPDAAGNDPLRCAAVRGPITLRRGIPCQQGAVGPSASVSFGFNKRLEFAEPGDGKNRGRFINLSSRILEQGNVPLAWDVDGAQASQKNVVPLLSAPSLGSQSYFANDKYWFPAFRHLRKMNVALIDGHVASTSDPLSVVDWNWSYVPPTR